MSPIVEKTTQETPPAPQLKAAGAALIAKVADVINNSLTM
jgi:hypothetical protein